MEEKQPAEERVIFRASEAKENDVEELLDVWATNRALYPDWLIAPAGTRDDLWNATECWIPVILHHAGALTVEQRLCLLYELNWRLERCLVPLTREIAREIRETLQLVNPYPTKLKQPNAELVAGKEKPKRTDWGFLAQAWTQLAAAMLRFSREVRDDAGFGTMLRDLDEISQCVPALAGRIRYEQALFALEHMDHAGARAALDAWQDDIEDPFSAVRKCAVLAELGDTKGAATQADFAVGKIRKRAQPGVEDYAMMSREGCAMLVVERLRAFEDEALRTQFRNRWQSLDKVGCNPKTELSLFFSALRHPAAEGLSECAGTTDRSWSNSARLSQVVYEDDNALVAHQSVRFLEEAAYLLQPGLITHGAQLLGHAVDCLAWHAPERAIGLALRLGDSKQIETFFCEHHLAMTPKESAVALRDIAAAALKDAVSALPPVRQRSPELRAKYRLAEAALIVLRCLAARLSAVALMEELDRAMQLYKTPAFRGDFGLASSLRDFFAALLECSPRNTVEAKLLDLFATPIPEVDGFEAPGYKHWHGPPFAYWTKIPEGTRQANPTGWENTVSWLLKAAGTKQGTPRERAVLRLSALHHAGYLTPAEAKRFGEAVWKHVDESKKLPTGTGLLDFGILQLHEPQPGAAEDAFRQFYLDHDAPRFVTQEKGEDGQVRHRIEGRPRGGMFFEEIVGASSNKPGYSPGEHMGVIDWTEEEAGVLLEKAIAWWQQDGRLLRDKSVRPPFWNPGEDCERAIIDLLYVTIIPRCTPGGELAAKVKEFLSELEAAGVLVERALPGLTKTSPEMRDEVLKRLRRGLVSPERDRAGATVRGICDWTRAAFAGDLPEVPTELLVQLAATISNRRQPVLPWALYYGAEIARACPQAIDDAFVDAACVGLKYLFEEARYRSRADSSVSDIEYRRIPEHRAHAARLASALKASCDCDDPVIEKWLREAAEDPLPRVRKAIEASD